MGSVSTSTSMKCCFCGVDITRGTNLRVHMKRQRACEIELGREIEKTRICKKLRTMEKRRKRRAETRRNYKKRVKRRLEREERVRERAERMLLRIPLAKRRGRKLAEFLKAASKEEEKEKEKEEVRLSENFLVRRVSRGSILTILTNIRFPVIECTAESP